MRSTNEVPVPANFPIVSEVPHGLLYYAVLARDPSGGEETWFVTENELQRIRERAARKADFAEGVRAAFPEPVRGWRAALVRWLGGFV